VSEKTTELIKKYKQTGDNEYFNKMITTSEMQSVIKYHIGRYIRNGWADYDNLYQHATIEIWDNIDSYKPSKGEPEQFFSTLINRKFYNLYRKNNRKKRGGDFKIVSMEKPLYGDSQKNLYDFIASQEDVDLGGLKIKWIIEKIEPELSKLELNSIILYSKGYRYKEIAEKLGRHRKAIDNALQRVRSKLERKVKYKEVISL